MPKSRSYCFTINNYGEDDLEQLEQIECTYIVYGNEVGDSGTPHLQGYVRFKNARQFGSVSKDFPRAHLEIARGSPKQNRDYCTKSGEFIERGEFPDDGGLCEKQRWEDARKSAKEGKFDDIPADIYLRCFGSIKRCWLEDRADPVDLETRPFYGTWIWGAPGTGKSHYVRTNYQEIYLKDCNKWWCGYHGQKTVVVDEIGPEHVFMGQLLKKWADKWTFKAEWKGGSAVIRPHEIVVTSNYTIEEIWKDFPSDIAALKRRFEVKHFTQVYVEEAVDEGFDDLLNDF